MSSWTGGCSPGGTPTATATSAGWPTRGRRGNRPQRATNWSCRPSISTSTRSPPVGTNRLTVISTSDSWCSHPMVPRRTTTTRHTTHAGSGSTDHACLWCVGRTATVVVEGTGPRGHHRLRSPVARASSCAQPTSSGVVHDGMSLVFANRVIRRSNRSPPSAETYSTSVSSSSNRFA